MQTVRIDNSKIKILRYIKILIILAILFFMIIATFHRVSANESVKTKINKEPSQIGTGAKFCENRDRKSHETRKGRVKGTSEQNTGSQESDSAGTNPSTTKATKRSGAEGNNDVALESSRLSPVRVLSEKDRTQLQRSEYYISGIRKEGKLQSIDTTVIRLTNEQQYPGVVVDLIGAIHIADRDYYLTLSRLFENYDVVLYEMVYLKKDANRKNSTFNLNFDGKAAIQASKNNNSLISFPDSEEKNIRFQEAFKTPAFSNLSKGNAENFNIRQVNPNKRPIFANNIINDEKQDTDYFTRRNVNNIYSSKEIQPTLRVLKRKDLFVPKKFESTILLSMTASPETDNSKSNRAKSNKLDENSEKFHSSDNFAQKKFQAGTFSLQMLGKAQKWAGKNLKLTGQTDEIDYQKSNMLHADMDAETLIRRFYDRSELLDFALEAVLKGIYNKDKPSEFSGIGILFARNRTLAIKRTIAELLLKTFEEDAKNSDNSLIIAERNEAALKVFDSVLKSGKKSIAIFYGCAHLPDLLNRLQKQYSFQAQSYQNVTAWEMKSK